MKILVLAPQPFYQERGTPIAVDMLVRSLSDVGHHVDLLTFAEGEAREYAKENHPRVRHLRSASFLGVKGTRPGFSIKKILLDVFFFFSFFKLMLRERYDVVHAVEESVFMALLICPLFRTKYVYDMDSSMAEQIADASPRAQFLLPILQYFESLPLRYADAVVPVCQSLADIAAAYRDRAIYLLKDVSLVENGRAESEKNVAQAVLKVSDYVQKNSQILMYIGNLESYQGIDFMLKSFSVLQASNKRSELIIVGGEQAHIMHYSDMCTTLNIASRVHFVGKQPVDHLLPLMKQADVLLSPRTKGTNTPMKIYSYLDSGVPVVATKIKTHTQVMSEDFACLVEPKPEAMADGIAGLLADSQQARLLAKNARAYIKKEHSKAAFDSRLFEVYSYLKSC